VCCPPTQACGGGFSFSGTCPPDIRAKIARTKWWKLRGEEAQTFKERMLGEGLWEEGADVDDMWLKMATCVSEGGLRSVWCE
jgi:hypothetical protein